MNLLQGLDELAVFECVARLGSFTAAAEELQLAKSTVSDRVRKLEAAVGVRLLQRSTRSVRTTPDGAALYERARRIVQDARDTFNAVQGRQEEPFGTLRITCPRLFGYAFLGPLIDEYLRRWPAVCVALVLTERSVDLVDEGFDLALRIGVLPDSSLVVRRLGEAQMAFVASPGYLDQRGRPRDARALTGHDLIGVSSDNSAAWPGIGAIASRFHVNSLVMARDAALSGAGIAFLPAFLIAEALAKGLLEGVLTALLPPPLPINALYPSSRQLSVRVRAFLDLLVARTQSSPPWSG